jgi:hypothetical protein
VKKHIQIKTDHLFDGLKIKHIIYLASAWIFIFSLIYYIIPYFFKNSFLTSSGGCATDYPTSLYFSIVTATTLGYGDVCPTGWLRACAAIEVLGGVILAGLAINAIVTLPSNATQRAIDACSGWWLERISVPDTNIFFSFTIMEYNGNVLKKDGFSYDISGVMHDKEFFGQVITSHFPVLFSIYEEDESKVYSEGIYRFEMIMDRNKKCNYYEGYCHDKKYGCRDEIQGKRITNNNMTDKSNDSSITDEEKMVIIDELFGHN